MGPEIFIVRICTSTSFNTPDFIRNNPRFRRCATAFGGRIGGLFSEGSVSHFEQNSPCAGGMLLNSIAYPSSPTGCPIERFSDSDVRALALSSSERDELPIYDIVRRADAPQFSFNPAISDSVASIRYGRIRQRTVKDAVTPVTWSLPGHGNASTSCGQYSSIQVCRHGHEFSATRHHCWKPSCPVCFPDWTRRKASELCDRLSAFDYSNHRVFIGSCWQHVAISPPQGPAIELMGSKEGFEQLVKCALEILEGVGIIGGVIFAHPWREDGLDGMENSDITGNTGIGDNWRTGPHFHAVCFGWIQPGKIKKISNESGWVIKSIASNLAHEDRINVSAYVLSHVGVGSIEGRRNLYAYRYFGVIANFCKIGEIVTDVPKLCSVCQSPMHSYPECLSVPSPVYTAERRGVYTYRFTRELALKAVSSEDPASPSPANRGSPSLYFNRPPSVSRRDILRLNRVHCEPCGRPDERVRDPQCAEHAPVERLAERYERLEFKQRFIPKGTAKKRILLASPDD